MYTYTCIYIHIYINVGTARWKRYIRQNMGKAHEAYMPFYQYFHVFTNLKSL